MIQFHNGLVEAYIGHYEDEITEGYLAYLAALGPDPDAVEAEGGFAHSFAVKKIQSHSNLERMEIYCEWNGIIGYASTLYHMAHDGGYISG